VKLAAGILSAILASGSLMARDLPVDVQAKFIRFLATSTNSPGRINCRDAALATELAKVGVTANPGGKLAWATSEAEVKALRAAGQLVVCGHTEWMGAGATIAIVEEDGRPQIYLHMGNLAGSGVTPSYSLLKIAKRI